MSCLAAAPSIGSSWRAARPGIEAESRSASRHSLNLIPYPRVDAGESIQVSQLRRRNGDGIARSAGERRLAGEHGIGVEGIPLSAIAEITLQNL
jgi:hypothetical protein